MCILVLTTMLILPKLRPNLKPQKQTSKKEDEHDAHKQQREKERENQKMELLESNRHYRIRKKMTEWLYSIDAKTEDIEFLREMWRRRRAEIIALLKRALEDACRLKEDERGGGGVRHTTAEKNIEDTQKNTANNNAN